MNRSSFLSLLGGVAVLAGGSLAHAVTLTGTVRDFYISHPDFEYLIATDPGIVSSTLGVDKKPVYAGLTGNPTTTGAANFDQWYRDVSGVNTSTSYSIELLDSAPVDGVYTYSNSSFFPIDGMLFGNESLPHNYHFTYELHTQFTYTGPASFSFTGDDDLWVFINDVLVIDLGGVHGPMTGSVALASLGLTVGEDYDLDLFFAERHTSGSNFRIDTSLLLADAPVPEAASSAGLTALGLVLLAGLRRYFRRA